MLTTSMGEHCDAMLVKVTMSLNKIVQISYFSEKKCRKLRRSDQTMNRLLNQNVNGFEKEEKSKGIDEEKK